VPLFNEMSPDEVAQIMQLSGAQFTRFTGKSTNTDSGG
jgi:hypothetical protein